MDAEKAQMREDLRTLTARVDALEAAVSLAPAPAKTASKPKGK